MGEVTWIKQFILLCLVPDWVAVLAKKTLTLVRWANSLHGSIFPHLSVSEDSLLSDDLYKILNKILYFMDPSSLISP